MSILEALAKVPADKWKLQSLQECFLRGDVKKKSASITFETTRELGLQMNAAAVIGKVEQVGMIIWVDADAWEVAKKSEVTAGSLEAFWREQAAWSQATFGLDGERGPIGPLKHLAKEVAEVMQDPTDLMEFVDCLFLIFDSTRRAGFTFDQLLEAAWKKLEINRARKWQAPPKGDEAIEHVREADATAPTLVCRTCKSARWAEIYPSKTDPTGHTLYCRRCEEGCVSPLVVK